MKVQGDIEGLISNRNLNDPRDEDRDEVLKEMKEGTAVKAVVLEVNPSRQKLALSRVDYLKKQNREEMSKYLHSEDEEGGTDRVTLGDLIKEKMTDS